MDCRLRGLRRDDAVVVLNEPSRPQPMQVGDQPGSVLSRLVSSEPEAVPHLDVRIDRGNQLVDLALTDVLDAGESASQKG
jgi:hypothetical protein